MTAELVLHLELDGFEVNNQKDTVKDLSGHHHAGELKGNVAIVADDAFGACANFDGDSKSYITVPSAQSLKITGDVTVEAWVYIAKAAAGWVRVIGKGTVDSRSYGLWYKMTDTTITYLFQRGHARPFHDCEAVLTLPATPLNTWYHLAGVVEGKRSSLYVHDLQGKLITQRELGGAPSGTLIDNDAHVTIGHDPSHAAHAGKVAQARIYKGSLSLAEIERDIGSDRLSLVPFRKSHPIDFRLNDDDDQPVLYIVDDSADAKVALVKLEFTNTSPQAINLPPLASGTSRDHHHFALRFHPGTLSASTIKKLTELTAANQATVLKEAADWELACLVGATGPVTLYLSYKGAKKSLKPQEQLTLTLHGVSADAGNGSRGTQVELLPHQLTYVGDDAPITGNRMRYIHITNHRGQKNIPLHVWLVDGNTVLNDGISETPLKLRISNGSGDRDITLNERRSKEASKFVISFEVGEAGKADWALTDRTRADNVKVKHGKSELTKIDRGQGASRTFEEWELTFPQKTVLAKRGSGSSEHVEITLEGIITAHSSGHANLYVRYEDILGYQDGQFILTVEKSPLVFDKKGNMAVGKLVQKAKIPKFDVAGSVVADQLSVSRDNATRGGLYLAGAGDLNHAIYNNLSNLDGEGEWDGAKWNTFKGLNIRVGNQRATPPMLRSALLINATGHVGIGTGLPKAKLEIALDDVDTTTNSLAVRKGTTNYLNIGNEGNVQIGDFAPAPEERYLKIAAGAKISPSCRTGIKLELGQHNEGYSIALARHQGTYGLRFDADRHPGCYEVARMVQQSYGVRGPDLFLDFYTGHLGIGTDTPEKMLDVRGELQVRGVTASQQGTPNLAAFYDKDKANGIGIGYNQIASIGAHPNQSILIQPKGILGRVEVMGPLQVQGNLKVNGLPIFDFGKRLTRDEWLSHAQMLKGDPNNRPGCFILFVREDTSDDLCCLVKKSNNEVRLLALKWSSNIEVK
jgi:hypothetical protein